MLYGFEDQQEEQVKGPFFVRTINTFTGKPEMVEVSKEVYDVFRRTGWNIENNDDSFYEHEIQHTSMCNSDSVQVENFHEFVSNETDPAVMCEKKERAKLAMKALATLSQKARNRFRLHYEYSLSYKQIAQIEGTTENAIKKSIKASRRALKKYFEKNEK